MKKIMDLLAKGDVKTLVSMGYVYTETFLFDTEDNFGKDLTIYKTDCDDYDFIVDGFKCGYFLTPFRAYADMRVLYEGFQDDIIVPVVKLLKGREVIYINVKTFDTRWLSIRSTNWYFWFKHVKRYKGRE